MIKIQMIPIKRVYNKAVQTPCKNRIALPEMYICIFNAKEIHSL